MRLHLRIPATSANLGPGFDILALAVQLQLDAVGERRDGGVVSIDAGENVPVEFTDPARNLVCTSYGRACDVLGVDSAERGVHIRVRSEIPVSRGLGSSAACTLAGVLLANGLRGDGRWDQQGIIQAAAAIEGHPDNAAAALLGGAVICVPGAAVRQIAVPDALRCVLFIPDVELSTASARRVVPQEYSRTDAVFNAARCALLVRALLVGELDDLGVAMEDRWHQPQRTSLMPWLPALVAAARGAGAHGAALSGAGPTVLALATGAAAEVGEALSAAAVEAGVPGQVRTLAARNFGARVELET